MLTFDNDAKDAVLLSAHKAVAALKMAAALAKSESENKESAVCVMEDGSERAYNVYGYHEYFFKAGDSLEHIAAREYGDAGLWVLLAAYNGIQTEGEVSAGRALRLPVIIEKERAARSRVLRSAGDTDAYGRDIRLGVGGGIESDLGDLGALGGPENLRQAIALRLGTAAGRRLRIGAYGVRFDVGDPMAVSSYLLGSIEQTMKEEPRVKRVTDIQLNGKGDALEVTVYYQDAIGAADAVSVEL
jgi:hypothetical protein